MRFSVSILADLHDETARAHELHGQSFEQGNDDKKLRRLAEEIGEVARAIESIDAAEDSYLIGKGSVASVDAARAHIRTELVQVASLAIRWINQIDGEGK